jgi:hypothetical protein
MSLKPAIAYMLLVVGFCAWALAHFPGARQVLIVLVAVGALNAIGITGLGLYVLTRNWLIRRRGEQRMGQLLDLNRKLGR